MIYSVILLKKEKDIKNWCQNDVVNLRGWKLMVGKNVVSCRIVSLNDVKIWQRRKTDVIHSDVFQFLNRSVTECDEDGNGVWHVISLFCSMKLLLGSILKVSLPEDKPPVRRKKSMNATPLGLVGNVTLYL